jgi:hypothetical protein
MFQLTTEAGTHYDNIKWLQYVCQNKLFKKLEKLIYSQMIFLNIHNINSHKCISVYNEMLSF